MNNLLGGGKFEYTKDEIQALEKAMQQKEFRDLLAEYMEEISDPKNKEEYDAYLKQLEGSQELPKGMKLIQPTACFCLKTKVKSKKNPNQTQKMFINVCQTPEIDKPNQEKDKKHKDAQKGQQWHIPYSVGKIRMDQDKDKNICQTVDVAYNPLTFEYCRKTEAFKKMICEIAVEAATKQIKDPDEIVSKDYKILNRLKCKGGKPAVMPIRSGAQPVDHDQQPQLAQRNEDSAPKLYQEFVKQQKEYKDSKAEEDAKKAAANKHVVELASKDFETIQETTKDQEKEENTKNVVAPKFKILHSYGVDYADYLMQPPDQGRKRPKQLIVKVELPRVEKMKELELDINEKNLVLKAVGKYYLDIALPFKINTEDGGAKFDSKAKVLTVTLNTVQGDEAEDQLKYRNTDEENLQGENENGASNGVEENRNGDGHLEGSSKESFLQVVNEQSQKKYKEDQEKVLERLANHQNGHSVEVLASSENTSNVAAPQKEVKKENQKTVNRDLDFLPQQDHEFYFFIYNVANYNKEGVKVALLDNEVLFSYQDEKRELSSWVKILKGYDRKQSLCTYVKDYVVVKLKKEGEESWENDAWKKESYSEEFENKLKVYDEEKRAEEEANKQNGAQQEKAEDKEEKEEEDEEEETEDRNEKEETNIEERFIEKRSINFINYDRNNFVFQLD